MPHPPLPHQLMWDCISASPEATKPLRLVPPAFIHQCLLAHCNHRRTNSRMMPGPFSLLASCPRLSLLSLWAWRSDMSLATPFMGHAEDPGFTGDGRHQEVLLPSFLEVLETYSQHSLT